MKNRYGETTKNNKTPMSAEEIEQHNYDLFDKQIEMHEQVVSERKSLSVKTKIIEEAQVQSEKIRLVRHIDIIGKDMTELDKVQVWMELPTGENEEMNWVWADAMCCGYEDCTRFIDKYINDTIEDYTSCGEELSSDNFHVKTSV